MDYKESGMPDMATEGIESNLLQITCQRALTNGAFVRGVQDFNFSVGGRYAWKPSKSYFRVSLKLLNALGDGGADKKPTVADQLAFADSVVNNLYDNCYVRAGGADISAIVNYSGQAGMFKNRTSRTGAWLDSIGKSAYGLDADFQSRVNTISSDGERSDTTPTRYRIGPKTNNTATYAPVTGLVAGANGTLWKTVGSEYKVEEGDTLVIDGVPLVVKTVTSNTALVVNVNKIAALTTNIPVGDQDNSYFIRKNTPATDQANNVYIMWQPPVGIFDHEGMLGSGDYKIQLNPNTNYLTAAIEAAVNSSTSISATKPNYTFTVEDVQFYCAIEKSNIPATGVEKLFLKEIQIQSKPLVSGLNSTSVLDFTVPPSTVKLAIFVQSNEAGTNNLVPLTKFKALDNSDEDLRQIQVTYANKTSPATNWDSRYADVSATDKRNYLTQRYHDSISATGLIDSEGGSESFDDWRKRGPLMVFDVTRDASDRSTNLQLQISYGNMAANTNVFVLSCFTQAVAISTTNGFISHVETLRI